MKHLNEEELIEYFYSKGKSAAAIERHLEACAECAKACAALKSDLKEMEFAEAPVRDDAYGERVWRSIAPLLPAYQARKRSWLRGGVWRGLSYAAACALLVICAFFAGRRWEHRQASTSAGITPAPAPQHAAPPPQRVVVVVLSDHLDRSERLLVELKHADADSEEMVSPLRDEARSLLAANRICRQNARQDDDTALATALDRLDHLLAELADEPGSLDAAKLARLQSEMSANGLLFEVRVLRSRIPDRQQAGIARSNGGTI
jgi:hypothetical protein